MDSIGDMARQLTRLLTPSGDIELFRGPPPAGTRGVDITGIDQTHPDFEEIIGWLMRRQNDRPALRDEYGRIYPHWFDRRGRFKHDWYNDAALEPPSTIDPLMPFGDRWIRTGDR